MKLNSELKWEGNAVDGFKAQGIRRIYVVESSIVGDNRFRPGIKRGAFTFYSNIPLHTIEDAQAICQSDHTSIVEEIEEATEELDKKLADISAGCDIERGDRLFRQVEVVKGEGRTQAQLDLKKCSDALSKLGARILERDPGAKEEFTDLGEALREGEKVLKCLKLNS